MASDGYRLSDAQRDLLSPVVIPVAVAVDRSAIVRRPPEFDGPDDRRCALQRGRPMNSAGPEAASDRRQRRKGMAEGQPRGIPRA